MLTVHATLQPNGQVQLPPALAKGAPLAVLVTILEPPPADAAGAAGGTHGQGSIGALRALLASPDFLSLPASDPKEVEARIQSLRDEWNEK